MTEKEPTTVPVDNEPTGESTTGSEQGKQAWVEELEVAGSQLVEQVKELLAEGNVRRLIIRNQEDKVLLEVPLTAGVAVGGVVTILSPVLAALGALAALIAKVKVQVIRVEEEETAAEDEVPPQDTPSA